MSETGPLARGLAGDCMVESAEGPVAMRDTPNKGFAVLTRLPSGQLGFRQLIKVVESGPVPLVRVVLDSGHTAVVARDHVFYRVGLEPVPAARLRPGDQLETAFRYPGDYAPPDATTPVRQTIAVRAIEPAGGHVHRRGERQLALRGAPPRRLREPARRARARRRAPADRRVHHRGRALRPAREPPRAARDRDLPWLAAGRARAPAATPGRGRARQGGARRLPRRRARPRRP